MEDATLTILHTITQHLDTTGNIVRILYINFSSAFNIIQPHVLIKGLLNLKVNSTTVLWIRSFLSSRSQRVALGGLSPSITSASRSGGSTGPPELRVGGKVVYYQTKLFFSPGKIIGKKNQTKLSDLYIKTVDRNFSKSNTQ